jgi:hypothetical protein
MHNQRRPISGGGIHRQAVGRRGSELSPRQCRNGAGSFVTTVGSRHQAGLPPKEATTQQRLLPSTARPVCARSPPRPGTHSVGATAPA